MSDQQERTNRYAAVEDEYAGYTVGDRDGSKNVRRTPSKRQT